MANKLTLKRSAVPGKVPTTADLDLGEIAINTYDGKAYMKKNVSGVESIVLLVGAGSGDVVGPASSADNAIARFDQTSGKIIQNSSATIDDSGNISSLTQQSSGTGANKIPVGTSAQRPTAQDGLIRFNSSISKFELGRSVNNTWNYVIERGLYRYMRYVVGASVNGHHPRCSRLYYIKDDGSRVNFVVFTSDNCADSGTIPTEGTTYTLDLGADAQEIGRGLGGYVSFAGARAAYVSLQGSNDNSSWTTIFTTTFSASACGLTDFYNGNF